MDRCYFSAPWQLDDDAVDVYRSVRYRLTPIFTTDRADWCCEIIFACNDAAFSAYADVRGKPPFADNFASLPGNQAGERRFADDDR